MAHAVIYPHPLTGRTIRLLNIEPGYAGSPLCCSLQEKRLDDASTLYYALSYCWGTGSSLEEITCNSQPLLITPNLHAVLLEYRRRGINIPLWVDAVCIDQSNVTERTSQVRMMQIIYSQAARVVVWLGEAAATDDMAIELLRAMYAPWAKFHDSTSGSEIPLFTGQNDANHDASLAARVPYAYFDALAAFLLRPWFSRIWIVQELICAREVTIWCGDATLNEDFPILEAAAHLFIMYNCSIKTQIATTVLEDEKVKCIRRLKLMCAGHLWGFKVSREQGPNGMLWYLLVTRYFDATDSRDKIFALVGLSGDVAEDFVDYSKSYADIVQDLSRMVLEGTVPNTSGSTLDFLSCITRDKDDNMAGASWVVDWLKLKDSLYTPLMNRFPSEAPTISQSSEVRFLDTEDGETLHVYGIIFDTITHIVPSPTSMHQPVPESELVNPQHILGCIAWVDEATAIVEETLTGSEGIYCASGESLYDAFWRTLCCNRSAEQPTQPPTNDSSYRAWRQLLALHKERLNVETKIRRTFMICKNISYFVTAAVGIGLTYRLRRHRFLLTAISLPFPWLMRFVASAWNAALQISLRELFSSYMKHSTQIQIDQRDFEHNHSQWTQGRQFALMQRGRMGWVPLAARVGDDVGLFAGCRVPFVLRSVEKGYKLVGDAYVHGVMDGEGEASEGGMLPIF